MAIMCLHIHTCLVTVSMCAWVEMLVWSHVLIGPESVPGPESVLTSSGGLPVGRPSNYTWNNIVIKH